MSTRHIAAENTRLHDLTPDGVSNRASKRFRQKLASDGFTVDKDFQLKPGYLYTVVRAISARVNQNYDGWPSHELKKAYKTFIGKPVFVNHENHDPTKARGVVVAARYVENGMDKYIEVVQEIDANRFPKLAHEIKTGGLDSVSMGAEAGFTICSYCRNKATDLHDMCDHVKNHKGKTLTRFDKRTGSKEDILVFESCHKISFFELSYVFEPADETAVASKVVVAGKHTAADVPEDEDWEAEERRLEKHMRDNPHMYESPSVGSSDELRRIVELGPAGHPDYHRALDQLVHRSGGEGWDPETDVFDPRSFTAAGDDLTVPAPPGTKTIDQSVIDSTPVINLAPATELTGHEAPGVKQSGKYTKEDFAAAGNRKPWESDRDSDAEDAAAIEIEAMLLTAAECPPGMDCGRNIPQGEQITKDSPNNPVNQPTSDPNGTGVTNVTPTSLGQPSGEGGTKNDKGLLPGTQALNDALQKQFPGVEIGGYREDPAYPDEHPAGKALDFMTTDLELGNQAMQTGFSNGADYAIWQNKMHYPDGSTKPYTGPNPHTDHVHLHHPGTAPTTRAARRVATPTDDYEAWKAEHGEDADKEHGGSHAPQNRGLHNWVREVTKRTAAELTPAENAKDTTRHNTIATYVASHDFLNQVGAPKGHSLDFGAGWGDSATHPVLNAGRYKFHTMEPYPNEGMVPDFDDPSDIDDGTYSRIHNLNVLNVAERRPRDEIVRNIGRILAPGGHAVITTRGFGEVAAMLKSKKHLPGPKNDPGSVIVNGGIDPVKHPEVRKRYQKGFTPDELHKYVQKTLGPGYTVTKVSGIGSAPAAVHIVRHPDNIPAVPPRPLAEQAKAAKRKRALAMKKVARNRALKLAWGEIEAPMAVDTLREEGSAPEDDNNDFERYVDPPKDLQTPDLSEARQVDREQELAGATPDQMGGAPGAADPNAAVMPQAPQQQYMTLQIPMPAEAPQVPQQAAPPQVAAPPMPPQGPPPPITASVLDYFDRYYGHRVANWYDAIEAGREMTPAEAADYRRQTAKLSTLENGRELSTTDRNPGKEPANMARNTIASRSKVARAGRRQHFAEGPLVDGGDRSRNDQGEQEEAFISQTPPEVRADVPTDDTTNISNTEHNLVARVQAGRDQLLRDARQLAALRQRRAFDEAGGPTATVVDPKVNTGPEGEALTGTGFISADPNDGVTETQPKDASLKAFAAFDSWLSAKTGKSSRRHTEANIKKAAAQFSREAGISPQALFPALGIVLREARKNDKQANTKGAKMRKRADEKLEVAAPDGRVDVEAPVANTTDAEAQASQFDIHDFGNNAGDNVANPDLSTDQNWAPGEASKTSARVKTAGGLLAMRCAEGMIAAGLEPNSRERKYQLAAEFENMNRGLIQDRVALLERFAAVREADRRRVASGSSRGAARSPIPAGLGGGTRTAAAGPRTAAHDPSNDSSLFI